MSQLAAPAAVMRGNNWLCLALRQFMGPLQVQGGLCLQDGSWALLFLFPHAWLPLKEVLHSPVPLSHERSRDGQNPKCNPFVIVVHWLKESSVQQIMSS